jgi:hypothetical protein
MTLLAAALFQMLPLLTNNVVISVCYVALDINLLGIVNAIAMLFFLSLVPAYGRANEIHKIHSSWRSLSDEALLLRFGLHRHWVTVKRVFQFCLFFGLALSQVLAALIAYYAHVRLWLIVIMLVIASQTFFVGFWLFHESWRTSIPRFTTRSVQ